MNAAAEWLNKSEARAELLCSQRTLDRYAERMQIGTRQRPIAGRRSETLYARNDVAAIADELRARHVTPAIASRAAMDTSAPCVAIDGASAIRLFEALAESARPQREPLPAAPAPLCATVEEAAAIAGVSAALIRRLCRRGLLGFRDVFHDAAGKRHTVWRIMRGDLEDLGEIASMSNSASPRRKQRPPLIPLQKEGAAV